MRAAAAFALFVWAGCTGAPAATFSHLEYAFDNYPTALGQNQTRDLFSGPSSGVLYVDFLGDTPDGGVRVEAKQWWWQQLRADQVVSCVLYAGGSLTCDRYPIIETAEFVLLPMLGRNYFSGIADKSAARVEYSVTVPKNYYSSAWTTDLTVLGWSGTVAHIDSKGVARIIGGPLEKPRQSAAVFYDRAKSLLVEAHSDLTMTELEGGIAQSQTVDLKLLKSVNRSPDASP